MQAEAHQARLASGRHRPELFDSGPRGEFGSRVAQHLFDSGLGALPPRGCRAGALGPRADLSRSGASLGLPRLAKAGGRTMIAQAPPKKVTDRPGASRTTI